MSCPTCDHTMQEVNATVFNNATIFHCPRCGTIKNRDGSFTVPKLVERCRKFEAGLIDEGVSVDCLRDNWREAGIAESINLPGDRPQ